MVDSNEESKRKWRQRWQEGREMNKKTGAGKLNWKDEKKAKTLFIPDWLPSMPAISIFIVHIIVE